MPKLTIQRVDTLPSLLQGNTVYFVEDQENGLIVSVTNDTGAVVKSTYSKDEILQWISDNAPVSENYDAVIQQIFQEIEVLRSSIPTPPTPFDHEW